MKTTDDMASRLMKERAADRDLLKSAGPEGTRFAIPLDADLPVSQQEALTRLQLRGWVVLIDVTRMHGHNSIMRIFKLTDEAKRWLRNIVN